MTFLEENIKNSTIIILCILFFLWFTIDCTIVRPTRLRLPPGPFRLPFIGSLFVFPLLFSDETREKLWTDLAKKYGKILHFQVGSLKIIWLNDLETIKDAFIGKGDLISDRRLAEGTNLFGLSPALGRYSVLGIGEANFGRAFKARKRLAQHSLKEFGFDGTELEDIVLKEAAHL